MSKRSPGPWALRGWQVRADNGQGQHIASYQTSKADGLLIAAAPELFELLLGACSSLDAAENASKSHCTADHIRERLAALGLIKLGLDEHGHESAREDPADTNPEVEATKVGGGIEV